MEQENKAEWGSLVAQIHGLEEPYMYFRTPEGVEYLGIGSDQSGGAEPPVSFLTRPFASAETQWWSPRVVVRLAHGQLRVLTGEWEPTVAEASGPLQIDKTRWDDHEYQDSVKRAIERIEQGDIKKVVIARRELINAAGPFSAACSLANLVARFPSCAGFALSRGDSVFIGATPEVLVRVRGREVFTDALAGSAPRGSAQALDDQYAAALMDDPKERSEHAWVVDMISSTLSEFVDALVVPEAPILKRLSNVQHLHSPISGRLKADVELGQLIDALHPTPAVAGWPTGLATHTIEELEGFDRELYAGVVGVLDRELDEGIACVAIRSAKLVGNEAWAYAGAGIVDGSEPAREARETRLKLSAVVEALA